MMRAVADTNIVVSGLMWSGAPYQVLEAARSGVISLFTTPVLLLELELVLQRKKFARRLSQAGVTVQTLVLGYGSLATVIAPVSIAPTIVDDPDDDAVLACAVAARAEIIVSGDRHLLTLGMYQGIPIRRAAEVLARIV
jgi:putative PIN family toxin of toxin-antitoxin system